MPTPLISDAWRGFTVYNEPATPQSGHDTPQGLATPRAVRTDTTEVPDDLLRVFETVMRGL